MRSEILQLAEKQMTEGGYANLNFSDIAEELGTTRANLHYHFKNKEKLAIEVVNQYSQTQFEQMMGLAQSLDGDFLAIVSAMEEFYWDKAFNTGSSCLCVCSQIAREAGVPQTLKDLGFMFYQKYDELICGILKKAIEDKQVRSDIDIKKEATRSHVIMMGVMTCGEHFIGIEQAKASMKGLLVDWAKSLT